MGSSAKSACLGDPVAGGEFRCLPGARQELPSAHREAEGEDEEHSALSPRKYAGEIRPALRVGHGRPALPLIVGPVSQQQLIWS
jgi:hypothetical protein